MSSKGTSDKPAIVLVHGAFADGSGWRHVIPLLEQDGYTVIAVQNPLTSFGEDVATTKRVIDAQKGSVVAVGHSYGGAVITGAAADNPAWKTIPSWYLVAQEDQAIKPELQRFMANRMGAHTTEIKSSHAPFISHPKAVAKLIKEAASAAAK